MSAPTVSPHVAPDADLVEGAVEGLLTAMGVDRLRRNSYGQWCTRGVYGDDQPHPSFAAALAVAASDDLA